MIATSNDTDRARRYGIATVGLIAVLTIGAIVLRWAWNTIAVDLFAAPVVGFRHALAAELALAVVAGLLAGFTRIGGNRGGSFR